MMSIPTVEDGQDEYVFGIVVWSGSKDVSKGRADACEV